MGWLGVSGSYLAFGVLGMPKGDLTSKQAIKAAGCNYNVVVASWSTLQPNGPGSALDPTAVDLLKKDFDQCAQLGLKILFEIALQYMPSWVISGGSAVESYVDQQGNIYNATTAASGKQVVNTQWTALGRQYIADIITKIAAAIGPQRVAQTQAVKCGGGYYGELHYAPSTITSSPYSVWAYGNSMQTGTGLASDLSICPLPGYTIYSGTDAQDSMMINWYLNGLATFILWFIAQMRSQGWNNCTYNVCHPGYGVRSNQAHSNAGYRAAVALGEDPTRMIGAYAHDPKIWPYCTWLNTADGFDPSTVDSDVASWKKIYAEAYKRNKHYRMWGENTGNENAAGLRDMFSGYQYGSALSGASYNVAPTQTYGFQGMFWLNYASLTDGNNAHAQMSDLAAAISAHTATL